MTKKILISIVIILAVIIVILGAVLLWPSNNPVTQNPPVVQDGIKLSSIKANDEVSSPLTIEGITDDSRWNGFEGQVGTVKLLDSTGTELALGILAATTDWMSPPVSFKTTLNFSSSEDQNGTLVFYNENPSGLPDKNKEFYMPVKIKKTSGENMTIKAYFYNNKMDPDPMVSCSAVFAVEREIPKTEGVAKAALEELLKGPTIEEKDKGYVTNIPLGSRLNSIVIVNGEALVDFNEVTESGGGSCSMAGRVAQIKETLLQFSTIKIMKLSIRGITDPIFQP